MTQVILLPLDPYHVGSQEVHTVWLWQGFLSWITGHGDGNGSTAAAIYSPYPGLSMSTCRGQRLVDDVVIRWMQSITSCSSCV